MNIININYIYLDYILLDLNKYIDIYNNFKFLLGIWKINIMKYIIYNIFFLIPKGSFLIGYFEFYFWITRKKGSPLLFPSKEILIIYLRVFFFNNNSFHNNSLLLLLPLYSI